MLVWGLQCICQSLCDILVSRHGCRRLWAYLTGNYENRHTYLTQEVFVIAKWNGSHPALVVKNHLLDCASYNSLCVIMYINLCLCIQYNNLLTPSLSLHPPLNLSGSTPVPWSAPGIPCQQFTRRHPVWSNKESRAISCLSLCQPPSVSLPTCHQTLHPAGGERERGIRALSASHKTCQECINQTKIH